MLEGWLLGWLLGWLQGWLLVAGCWLLVAGCWLLVHSIKQHCGITATLSKNCETTVWSILNFKNLRRLPVGFFNNNFTCFMLEGWLLVHTHAVLWTTVWSI